MIKEFMEPHFEDRVIELRLDDGEICIYATPRGLEKLISFCRELLDRSSTGHIHLEDYEVLTKDSLKGTIAIIEAD